MNIFLDTAALCFSYVHVGPGRHASRNPRQPVPPRPRRRAQADRLRQGTRHHPAQQRAATDLAAITRPFGTSDISLILARITRGLLLANALEARVVALAARPAAPPRPARAPTQREPRAPRPASAKPTAEADHPRLALLPTPEQIAAEACHRA